MLRILVIFVLMMLAVSSTAPVWAETHAESITIIPFRGAPGITNVTVSGSNFAASSSVSITYDGSAVATASTGSGSWTQSFLVPKSGLGSHTVSAGTASATFTVTSRTSLSLYQGKVGAQVIARGDGFAASQGGITLAFDGEQLGTFAADSSGSFTFSFVVPPRPQGSYAVNIGETHSENFTLNSFFSVTPSSGPPGTTVELFASGFTANSTLSITFDGWTVRSITMDSQGSISTSFQIPIAAGGPRSIGIYHASLGTTKSTFSVTPTLSLDRRNVAPGDFVTATGSGFAKNEPSITVTIDQTSAATGITADANGSWTASLVVPSLASGSHSTVASGSLTSVGKAPAVTLTLGAGLSLERSNGAPGTVVEVRGSGFKPSESITVTAGKGLTEFGATANSRGVWTANVTIPPAPTGRLTIQASSAVSVPVEIDFTVTPAISMAGTGGEPGASITVTGSGFGANESGITVNLDLAPVASGISANSEGSWSASFPLPSLPTGSYNLLASGSQTSATSVSEISVAIRADLNLDITSGPPGTTLTVRGAGFKASERVTVTVGPGTANTTVAANGEGVWAANVTIPNAPSGLLAIRASGAGGQQMAADFTVTPIFSVSHPTGIPNSLLEADGTGFGAGQSVSISFADQVMASPSANAQGSWSTGFPIPETPAGNYSITVLSPGGELKVPFRVTPAIIIGETHGEPGASIDLSGFGFAPDEKGITVTLDQTQLVSGISASRTGSWNVTFIVPSFPAQSYAVGASGPVTSSGSLADEIITIVPRLILSPAGGVPGSVVNVVGNGFRAQERDIVISYDGAPVAKVLTADAQGTFTTSFAVPSSASGLHFISHSGAISIASGGSEASFQVERGISLDQTEGPPGSSIIISGLGFTANDPLIKISYDNDQVLSQVLADSQGSFTTSIVIPASPAGSHMIEASGSDLASFTNPGQGFSVSQSLALSISSGNVGGTVEVAGLGFAASAPVTLAYDGELTEATVVADASGSFVFEFPIPVSIHGDHVIKVTDKEGHEVQATFAVEDSPPEVATLLGPDSGTRAGLFGGFRPSLNWAPVDDDSGVTYDLQVGTGLEFSNPILEKGGLTDPSYALLEREALSRGTYYWRVRAVDRASNTAPWSEPFEVKSGVIAPWMILVVIALGAMATGGAGYSYVSYRRKRLSAGLVFPELSRNVAIGPAPPQAAPGRSPALRSPFRLALPAPSRRQRARSPEEQAHLQLVLDFMRSLPFIQLSSDLKWLDELKESAGGVADGAYEQVLEGQLQLGYQPEWLRHPTYEEVQRILQGHEFLQRLDEYIQAVNEITDDTVLLIRQVDADLAAALPGPTLGTHRWRFDLAVVQNALSWYRGTYLRQASTRDYLIVRVSEIDEDSLVALHGEEATPFPGLLIGDLDENEALLYRDLHIQLRTTYTNSDEARTLAARMVSVDFLREQLTKDLAELDQNS